MRVPAFFFTLFLLCGAGTTSTIGITNVSADLLSQAFTAKRIWNVNNGSRVFIVPHHLVAAREIASLVSVVPEPSRVYLISPDHFSRGRSAFTSTDRGFLSFAGSTPNDPEQIRQLETALPASLRNDATLIEKEHGVTGLIPYMKHAWPNAAVIPVTVRLDTKDADRVALANVLVKLLKEDPRAIIVGSVDFSHYLPAEVADFHDELAEDVIRSLSFEQADRVEIDSPGALSVILNVARSLGLGNVTVHAHTNSLRLLKAKIAQESTSHFLVSFAPGEIKPRRVETTLLVETNAIPSAENRFYQGQDRVLITAQNPFHLAVGLVRINGRLAEIHLFPVSYETDKPALMTGATRRNRLRELAKMTDPKFADDIRQGVLRLIK